MAASCACGDSWLRGGGSRDWGNREASGGTDIRQAKGAEVCGAKEACGSHGAINSLMHQLMISYVQLRVLEPHLRRPIFSFLDGAALAEDGLLLRRWSSSREC